MDRLDMTLDEIIKANQAQAKQEKAAAVQKKKKSQSNTQKPKKPGRAYAAQFRLREASVHTCIFLHMCSAGGR
eukprot:g35121.t1